MPTPEVLNIEAMLAPIAGDDPTGGPIPFTLRERLDQARKEINPDDYDAKDPRRPAEAKLADWPGIVQWTSEALAGTSKDLLLTARLVEAATKVSGFAGLRDSLRLIRRLVGEAWDRIRPVIEEPDDLEVRAAALNWLDDADRGARFPITIRGVRLIESPAGSLSWSEWNKSRNAEGGAELVEKIVDAAPRETCQAIADDLDEVVAELGELLALCNEKMGTNGPGLIQVRQAVIDCRTLAHQVLERKGPAPQTDAIADETSSETGSEAGETVAGGPIGIGRIVANRAQAYQRLIEVANALEAIEPHSPIPHVIRRAVALGQLSFPELMKELIKDAAVLGEMSRNLGIKELAE